MYGSELFCMTIYEPLLGGRSMLLVPFPIFPIFPLSPCHFQFFLQFAPFQLFSHSFFIFLYFLLFFNFPPCSWIFSHALCSFFSFCVLLAPRLLFLCSLLLYLFLGLLLARLCQTGHAPHQRAITGLIIVNTSKMGFVFQ